MRHKWQYPLKIAAYAFAERLQESTGADALLNSDYEGRNEKIRMKGQSWRVCIVYNQPIHSKSKKKKRKKGRIAAAYSRELFYELRD